MTLKRQRKCSDNKNKTKNLRKKMIISMILQAPLIKDDKNNNNNNVLLGHWKHYNLKTNHPKNLSYLQL